MRCQICKKKISPLLQLMHTCRCGKVVCSTHKSESSHRCTFDWKKHGEDILTDKLQVNERTNRIQII